MAARAAGALSHHLIIALQRVELLAVCVSLAASRILSSVALSHRVALKCCAFALVRLLGARRMARSLDPARYVERTQEVRTRLCIHHNEIGLEHNPGLCILHTGFLPCPYTPVLMITIQGSSGCW